MSHLSSNLFTCTFFHKLRPRLSAEMGSSSPATLVKMRCLEDEWMNVSCLFLQFSESEMLLRLPAQHNHHYNTNAQEHVDVSVHREASVCKESFQVMETEVLSCLTEEMNSGLIVVREVSQWACVLRGPWMSVGFKHSCRLRSESEGPKVCKILTVETNHTQHLFSHSCKQEIMRCDPPPPLNLTASYLKAQYWNCTACANVSCSVVWLVQPSTRSVLGGEQRDRSAPFTLFVMGSHQQQLLYGSNQIMLNQMMLMVPWSTV